MNALSDLASEVKFRERKRGYDHEEVDNYVQTVSQAATQAANRIAALEHRLAQHESKAGKEDGATEIRETLLRTLVLAQRTADSAVSEARSEAQSITDSAKERAAKTVSEAETAANERLRSAEERADRILAESEENSQLIIAEAKRTAAAELAAEREQAKTELRDLQASKSDLETVVAEIQARLDNEFNRLRSLAVSFHSFVEKFELIADIEELFNEPEASRSGGRTDAEGRYSASGGNTDDKAAALDAPESAAGGEQTPTDAADAAHHDPEPAPKSDPESAHGSGPDSEETARASGGALEGALPADAVDSGTVPDLSVVGWDGEIELDQGKNTGTAATEPVTPGVGRLEPSGGGNGSAGRKQDDSNRGAEVASAGPATMPFGADSPELFDIDAEEDDGFIEQLRRVVSSDAPLPDEDAAMAAFFDHGGGAERPMSAAHKSGNSGTRSTASGRGGRLGPRA